MIRRWVIVCWSLFFLMLSAAGITTGGVDLEVKGIRIVPDGDDDILSVGLMIRQANSEAPYTFEAKFQINDELVCAPTIDVAGVVTYCPTSSCVGKSCSMSVDQEYIYGSCDSACSCVVTFTCCECRIVGGLFPGDEVAISVDSSESIQETDENNNVYTIVY